MRPRATNAARRCPSHASHTNSDDPGMKRASRVPGGNRTRLASLEGWYLCQSATGTCRRKGRESNPQGREAHPASNGVPSPLGLPFRKAAAAGIEPASARLTAAHPYQHGNHRITSVRTAGFEPTVSCAQSRRIARLSWVLISAFTRAPSGSRTRTSAMARRQAAATSWALRLEAELSKNSEHREGLEPSSPQYGCGVFASGPPVRFFQWDQRGSNPHPPG